MTSENDVILTAGGGDTGDGPVRLSVVIPCYNAEQTIGDQLEALARQTSPEPWEVIVANNRSTDGSVAVIDSYRKRMHNLRLVEASKKQGAGYAMNVGARAARGELLAFCDADDVVGDGWIAAMASALAVHKFVSGPHEIALLNSSTLQKSRRNSQPTGVQQYTNPPYLPHAGSGNMGIRRSEFERVGGFDESMAALFDTDLCWRVQLAGTPLEPAPGAILHVRYRDTGRSLYRQARSYGEWNVFIYKRYRPHGMPKLHWKHGVAGWIDLVRKLPALLHPAARTLWIWNFGWRVGRLKGCIKYGVLAP